MFSEFFFRPCNHRNSRCHVVIFLHQLPLSWKLESFCVSLCLDTAEIVIVERCLFQDYPIAHKHSECATSSWAWRGICSLLLGQLLCSSGRVCVCVCLYACVCLCPLGHMRSRKRWRRLLCKSACRSPCLFNKCTQIYIHMLWWMSHHLCCCMTTLDYRRWENYRVEILTLPSHYLLFYNFTFRLLKFCLARCYGSFRWFQLARF